MTELTRPTGTHDPQRVQVLAIPGSLRRASHNRSLLQAAVEVSPDWIEVEVYDSLGEVPLFDEDLEGRRLPVGVRRLRDAVGHADAVLISTPAYNQAVPGVLKNALDWLSRFEPPQTLEAKPVAVTGVTTGPWGTRIAQTMLRQMLVSLGAHLLPGPHLYVAHAGSRFDEGRLVDPDTRRRLAELVEALAMWTIHLPGWGRREGRSRAAV